MKSCSRHFRWGQKTLLWNKNWYEMGSNWELLQHLDTHTYTTHTRTLSTNNIHGYVLADHEDCHFSTWFLRCIHRHIKTYYMLKVVYNFQIIAYNYWSVWTNLDWLSVSWLTPQPYNISVLSRALYTCNIRGCALYSVGNFISLTKVQNGMVIYMNYKFLSILVELSKQ